MKISSEIINRRNAYIINFVVCFIRGQEGSMLRCFKINPGGTYLKHTHELGQRMHIKTSGFPHITLAVSRNHAEIRQMKKVEY